MHRGWLGAKDALLQELNDPSHPERFQQYSSVCSRVLIQVNLSAHHHPILLSPGLSLTEPHSLVSSNQTLVTLKTRTYHFHYHPYSLSSYLQSHLKLNFLPSISVQTSNPPLTPKEVEA
uniref:Uncharacterized protein MANES_01G170300 n=1 Tax=Rhizophora mucronata TaxID=61149 RepID=A0A2P2MG14_RHIMU